MKPEAWPAESVEKRPLSDLVPYARNARTHSPEQIDQVAASIREWGWTIPILVDEKNTILAGHARLAAAQKLGIEEAPVMVARGWSEAQKRAYILADNKLAENADWDKKKLVCELEDLREMAFPVEKVGFSADELVRLLDGQVGLTDPDSLPEEVEKVTRPGDLWGLGSHRVLCGDSTDPEAVDKLLAGVKPHLMVTDPPYGVNYSPKWRHATGLNRSKATGQVENDDRADWREAWECFPGHVAYVWHSTRHCVVVAESLESKGFNIRSQIVWVKQRPVISRSHYHHQHEPVFYAVKGQADDQWRFREDHGLSFYAVRGTKSAEWNGDRRQSTVWFIEHLAHDSAHGTQKPVECMKRPMENNSSEGQAVYDPFLGSGTSVIAAEMLARVCFGLELSPAYVDVIVSRWQEFTGQKASLADGRTFDEVSKERNGEKAEAIA